MILWIIAAGCMIYLFLYGYSVKKKWERLLQELKKENKEVLEMKELQHSITELEETVDRAYKNSKGELEKPNEKNC